MRRTNFKDDCLYFFEQDKNGKWREAALFITFDVTPYTKLRSDWVNNRITKKQLKEAITKICGN